MDPTFSFPENWTPPRELVRASPRETALTGRGVLSVVLAGLFLLAAVPMFLLLRNQQVSQAARNGALRAQGREATGEIARLWHEGKSSTPMVAYAFTADGVRIRGESSVPQDRWAALQKAGFLSIRYLPSNPSISHPAAWGEPSPPAWVPFIFPVVLIGSSALLLFNLKRQAEKLAEGVPVAGVVTKCYRVRRGWSVRYQYRAKDGTVMKGSDQLSRPLDPGAAICVQYLPRNPQKSQVYPPSLFRVKS